MACKRSAVRSRLAPPDSRARGPDSKARSGMEQLGRYTVYAGVVLIAVGLIGGFTAMFRDADAAAVNLLVLVPLGFAALLTGTVVSQLLVKRDQN